MVHRVVVAMSGGVDSSVAAALLKEQGYEVIGITMCLGIDGVDSSRPNCCGAEGIADAKRVADILGIKHYVLNFGKEFKQNIVDDFFSEYSKGRTPNPCVKCNELIKFGSLLSKAKELGARYMATGHYAAVKDGFLVKAKDPKKDQSYFLYRIGAEALKSILFPVSEYSKIEVRALAKKYNLHVSAKPDSQEVCFIPEGKLAEEIAKTVNSKKGPVVDGSGKVLGQHKGIANYTIGQRQGLGIAAKYPLYITRIDVKSNTIFVGNREEIYAKGFICKDLVLYGDFEGKTENFDVKIRHLHKESPAVVKFGKNQAEVIFDEPQFAVTPGQSTVFYRNNKVLGGGIIDSINDR